MGEAVSRVQIRNSDGKTLIDALMSRGGNEMVEFKMTDVGTQWYLRRSDCPNDSILLRERAMQNYARMLITDLNKPGQPEYVAMYPEGIDHNGVELALQAGKDVPNELVMQYPDLVSRFGL